MHVLGCAARNMKEDVKPLLGCASENRVHGGQYRVVKHLSCGSFLLLLLASGCVSQVKLLPVPDVRQATDYTCGVAASQAILRYYGMDFREDLLASEFGTTEAAGTSPEQIVAGLQARGLTATIRENTTLEDLRVNLQQGWPTMVPIQAWHGTYPPPDWSKIWEDGHWVVVIGMDAEKVYFEDPALLGSRGWLTPAEFLARWHDYQGEPPCCDARDTLVEQLSITVKGSFIENAAYIHID